MKKDFLANKRERKVLHFNALEVKQEDRNGVQIGVIEGYASTYEIDRGGDQIMPGAFLLTLAEHRKKGRQCRMYFQHDSDELIGGFPIESMREDDKGLFVRGEINLTAGQCGEMAYSLAKQGVLTDMSIGFSIPSMEDVEWVDIEGEEVRQIKNLNLWEISLVSEPMNEGCTLTSIKSVEACKSLKDVERLLKGVGFSANARKALISAVKKSTDRDGLDESDKESRDGLEDVDIEAVASKVDNLLKSVQIGDMIRKLS